MGTIYIWTDKRNGMNYVGKSVNYQKRLYGHYHGKLFVDNVLRKYGIDNFDVKLMDCINKYLIWMEEEWIKEMDCIYPKGYNILKGGNDGNTNYKCSQETKRKLSEANKGFKNGFFGKKHTKETKNKMKEKALNRTTEQKKKISDTLKRKGIKPPSRLGCIPWNKKPE